MNDSRVKLAFGLYASLICLSAIGANAHGHEPEFGTDIVSVLSKAGCNSGGCHGNSSGKGGFKLSLRSEHPADDYAAIVEELAGRRVNRVDPDASLILLKATAQVPHQGGRRFDVGSLEYRLLRDWISQGFPRMQESRMHVLRLDVRPIDYDFAGESATKDPLVIVAEPNKSVALRVTAEFSDGETRDVTPLAIYEVSNLNASVDATGKVSLERIGQSTVFVRYLGRQAAVRLALVPGGDFVWTAPAPANFVDRAVYAQLRSLKLNPSAPAVDTVFIRRAYLDLLGVLPSGDQTRAFVANADPEKRTGLIERLLASPEYAERWALKWSDILRVEEKVLDRRGVDVFYDWIRQSFADDLPLNVYASQMIAARGSTYQNPPANFWRANRDPLTRGENTARVLLGVRLQCAKCHNHPHDRWSQDEYYQWAAVFADIDYQIIENKRQDKYDKHEFNGEQIVEVFNSENEPRQDVIQKLENKRAEIVKHPRTGKPVSAKILDQSLGINADADKLQMLARWIESEENLLFARMQVNRVWMHVMGKPLVEPVDDLRPSNPPANPILLDELTKEFVASGFSVKQLLRTIMASNTYQASSQPNETNPDDQTNFSRAIVRRLDAEQLLDAQSQVLGVPAAFQGYPEGTRAGQIRGAQRVRDRDGGNTRGDRFLKEFGKPRRLLGSECERTNETNLSQTLTLISDHDLQERLCRSGNRLHQLCETIPADAELIETLYWMALCRAPSEFERTRFVQYIAAHPQRLAAVQDVTWALLNAKEFMYRY